MSRFFPKIVEYLYANRVIFIGFNHGLKVVWSFALENPKKCHHDGGHNLQWQQESLDGRRSQKQRFLEANKILVYRAV
jgi:hypothetical protein